MKLAMFWTGLDFKECAQKIDAMIGNIEAKPMMPEYDPLPALQRMQATLQEVDGINPVRRYLKSRGLHPSPLTRYCPEWKYWDNGNALGSFPAMVHQFKSPDNAPLTWHITYLTNDGRKAPVPSPRKVMTAVGRLSGGAIQLFRAGETLGIAEGIETALAAHKLHGIPVWASYSATLLESFQPPQCAKSIVIFADNDSNFTGQKSAYILANRLALKGYRVSVEMPKRENTDFADEVQA
jgi:putative DNA primase/helicase